MTEYEKFQQMMSDLEYFKENGIPRGPEYLKFKDGSSFMDMFGDIFNNRK